MHAPGGGADHARQVNAGPQTPDIGLIVDNDRVVSAADSGESWQPGVGL
jgi:hypothetical protein